MMRRMVVFSQFLSVFDKILIFIDMLSINFLSFVYILYMNIKSIFDLYNKVIFYRTGKPRAPPEMRMMLLLRAHVMKSYLAA